MTENQIEVREDKKEAKGRHIVSMILLVLSAIITFILFVFSCIYVNASVNAENGLYKLGMFIVSLGYVPAAILDLLLEAIGIIIQLTLKKRRSKVILILQLIVLVLFIAALIMYFSAFLTKKSTN